MSEAREILVSSIDANPDQPRKHFDEGALQELASSIKAEGLLQPIRVMPNGRRWTIVAGERRWRAHKLIGRRKILAVVEAATLDEATLMVRAIVENAQRRDVSPIEEAFAFQACLDKGMSLDELALRLGFKQPHRIEERTCLLSLRPEYQTLLRGRQLSASQGYEMAQLSPPGQDALFQRIKRGECATYDALRAASLEIRDAEAQLDLDEGRAVMGEADRRKAKSFETRVSRLAAMLREGIVEGEIVAVKKVNADKASRFADLMAAMRTDLARIETALRAQADAQMV